jgi:hypothetical protein
MAAYTVVFMRILAAFAIMSSMTGAASLSLDDSADHAINASTAVAFTVSQEADAIGSVANGSGTSATDAAASLDTDSSLKPSLSVDATNPAHVTFTVSGLEPDYSGTVTFSDASGTRDVIPIESNGAYAANLSNLTNGTITYLLSVSDPAGNVITVDPPLNLGDGSTNAPAGTPQLPTLLNGYAVRPSWNVAGVDYYVGVPAGTILKNPATISMAGVSVNTTSHTVTITGNDITLSGYDFSLNGGWQVYVAGNNDTIEDCNFAVGSNGQTPISIGVNGQIATNTTVKNNTINGNGIWSGGVGLIECSGTGTTTIEYNSITNAYNGAIVLGNTTSSAANYVVQYNLIENTGEGSPKGAHGDWIQVFNSPGDTSDVEINYNTFVQNAAGDATQGLSLQSAAITQGPVLSETVENNTMVVTGSNTVNYAIIVDTTNLDGSATVSNNYIVPTGIAYRWLFGGKYNAADGPYSGTLTYFNNFNMVTGSYYSQRRLPSTTAPPRPTPAAPAEAR